MGLLVCVCFCIDYIIIIWFCFNWYLLWLENFCSRVNMCLRVCVGCCKSVWFRMIFILLELNCVCVRVLLLLMVDICYLKTYQIISACFFSSCSYLNWTWFNVYCCTYLFCLICNCLLVFSVWNRHYRIYTLTFTSVFVKPPLKKP